jgi:hypothetical protein
MDGRRSRRSTFSTAPKQSAEEARRDAQHRQSAPARTPSPWLTKCCAKSTLLKGSVIPADVDRQHHAQLRRDGGGEVQRAAPAHGHRGFQRRDPDLAHARLARVGIVAVAIPATLALTLLVFYLYGFTLNRITLFALIFSIGILVDDAIVVVENIVRHFHLPQNKGRNWSAIAVEAVGEVGNPTILATFAVIAAVLPMAFVGGLMGPYMRPDPDWRERGDVLVAAHRLHRHAMGFDSHPALGEANTRKLTEGDAPVAKAISTTITAPASIPRTSSRSSTAA